MTVKNRSKLKATVVEDVTPKSTPSASSIHDDLQDLIAKHELAFPSMARTWAGLVLGAASAAGISYFLIIPCVEMLMIAAIVYTGSMFLAFIIQVLGMMLIYAASFTTTKMITEAVTSSAADQCYQKCSNKVRGWFSSRNREVTV